MRCMPTTELFPFLKLGGINSSVSVEYKQSIPIIHENPTLILGLHISHGSPGRSDLPSIAAVTLTSISRLISTMTLQCRKNIHMYMKVRKPCAPLKAFECITCTSQSKCESIRILQELYADPFLIRI